MAAHRKRNIRKGFAPVERSTLNGPDAFRKLYLLDFCAPETSGPDYLQLLWEIDVLEVLAIAKRGVAEYLQGGRKLHALKGAQHKSRVSQHNKSFVQLNVLEVLTVVERVRLNRPYGQRKQELLETASGKAVLTESVKLAVFCNY